MCEVTTLRLGSATCNTAGIWHLLVTHLWATGAQLLAPKSNDHTCAAPLWSHTSVEWPELKPVSHTVGARPVAAPNLCTTDAYLFTCGKDPVSWVKGVHQINKNPRGEGRVARAHTRAGAWPQ